VLGWGGMREERVGGGEGGDGEVKGEWVEGHDGWGEGGEIGYRQSIERGGCGVAGGGGRVVDKRPWGFLVKRRPLDGILHSLYELVLLLETPHPHCKWQEAGSHLHRIWASLEPGMVLSEC